MHTDVSEVLSRAVGSFIDPDGAFRKKLEAKVKGEYPQDLVVKIGVDPTRPDIHLGHAVVLRKLRQLQDMGCKVIFLVGDFTARIGDPTGKSKIRPEIEQADIERNMQTFVDQVGKILRTDPTVFAWIRNSDWFTNVTDIFMPADSEVKISTQDGAHELTVGGNTFPGKAAVFESTRMQKSLGREIHTVSLVGFLWTLRHITHGRLIERDMFQDRIDQGAELYMHEMMYPVLQGIDSVMIARVFGSCDLEVGGTDQTFNMLVGRDAMKINTLEQQAVLSFDILPGLDGKEKMSKSLDNYIAVTDLPNDMYGKVMSVPDACLSTYFRLATYTPEAEIAEMEKRLSSGAANPRDEKMRLAHQIVAEYHGADAAEAAEANFVETFSKGGIPSDVESIEAALGTKLVELLLSEGLVESKSEWRRLVTEGAVRNAETDEKITSPDAAIEETFVLKVGKRRFVRIVVS